MLKETKVPEMLTIKETAAKSRLSPYLIRQLVLTDKVSYIKSGKKYLINWEKFIDFLNGNQDEQKT